MPPPYLITFHTYGTWLHGRAAGSVDDTHNTPGTPRLVPNTRRERYERSLMTASGVHLDNRAREIVGAAVRSVCDYRGWVLAAINVRTNHVHIVVRADVAPELIMSQIKAYATRALRAEGVFGAGARVWGRHGSTRWLNTPSSLSRAIHYVLYEQDQRRGLRDRDRSATVSSATDAEFLVAPPLRSGLVQHSTQSGGAA